VPLAYLAGPLEQPVPKDVMARLSALRWRRPFAMMGAVLEARPKRELSPLSAAGRAWARAVRMYKKGRAILKAEERRKQLAPEVTASG
jgi:hypothetical protein